MEIKSILGEKVLIEWRKMESLQPDNLKMPYNIGHLKKSLLENNFAMPFFGWQNGECVFVIDGHQRREVLSELESEGVKVPELLDCQLINAKDRQQAIKLLLSVFNSKSNPIDLEVLTEWVQIEEVEVEITSLNVVDLNDVQDEIQEILEANEDDFDSTPPETPETVLWDLYEIGEHRLLCGDSTCSDTVAKLMDGKKADMVFTDPPYGANMGIQNDKKNEFKQVFSDFISILPCDDNIYICSDWRCVGFFINEIENNNYEIYNLVIWVKNLFGQGKLYHTKHEEIIFCGKGNYRKDKLNDDVNVWQADSVRNFGGSKNAQEAVGHPTQKPVEICSRAINNSSIKNEIIYDGFLGSGSTMVASHQLKRKCYGMELDPKYCDVIIKRMIKLDSNLKVKRNGIDETKKWIDKIK